MADMKISELANATGLTGAEFMALVQAGDTAKGTLEAIKDYAEWVRPADWPAMPAPAANTIHILVPVFENGNNTHMTRISVSSGTWSIDWGDGSAVESGLTSNTQYNHTYSWSDVDLPAATSRGYKVAIITVTTSGGNITTFSVGTQSLPGSGQIPGSYLEVQIQAASMTSLALGGNSAHRLLEHVNIVACGTLTTHADFLYGCNNMQKLQVPSGFYASTTSLSRAFQGCMKLKSLDLSSLGGAVTTINGAFASMYSLRSLVFPSGSLDASLTDMGSAFQNCFLLESITFPSGSLSAVTNAQIAFASCNMLRNLVFPAGAFAAVTQVQGMFTSCQNLHYIEFPSGSCANITRVDTMFNGCAMLQHVKFPSGAFAVAMTNTATFCTASNLARMEGCAISITFSLTNNRLTAAALDEIYTALPTITSQTITVTNNPGTTGDTPSIATAKGWTVTG